MSEDVRIDANYRLTYDSAGRLDTVDGDDFIRQVAVVIVTDAADELSGGGYTPTKLRRLESRIERRLIESQFFETATASAQSIEDGQVVVRVETDAVSLTTTV
jgi:hypothetical protein